jgi:type I restriction enzyme S subunit
VKRGYSETYYSGDYPEEYILSEGDLLVGMDGEFNIARWKCSGALLNQRVCKLVAKIGTNEEYLRFAMSKSLKEIEQRTAFVTVKHLSAKELNKLELDVPELTKQDKIADILSRLERVIEARKEELEELDGLIKARFVEMFGDPVTNPKGLPIVALGELSKLITKGASPSWQGFSYTDDSSQTIFVTSENVREGYIDLSSPKYIEDGFNEKQKRSVIHKGDFLINIVGASIGRAAQFNLDCKANMNQAAALVRVNDSRVRDKYLLTYLNSDRAQRMYDSMKSDTGRANLSLQDISDLLILLPNVEQQIEFEMFANQVDKSKFAVQKTLEQTQTLFDSLMQKYFG